MSYFQLPAPGAAGVGALGVNNVFGNPGQTNYTFATLPVPGGCPGNTEWTVDQGLCVWNGIIWLILGGSGVSSIVAGSGITITPTVGTGVVTINSTSSTPNYGPNSTTLTPSGDTSGVTDTANVITAYVLATQHAVLAPYGGVYAGLGIINFLPGIFYINSPRAMMFPVYTGVHKLTGLQFEGAGSGITFIQYSPTVSGPMFQNQYVGNLQMTGITFYGTDGNSDFMQSQEQGGGSNIQYFNYSDVGWTGAWRNTFVLTGGNNNSEWDFDRCSWSGSPLINGMLIPGAQTATVTGGQANIAIDNSLGAFDLGTNFSFGSALGNLASGTNYYVVASTTTTMQVSLTRGGTVVTPSTSGTTTANSGNNQFLNFWFLKCKFWPSQGSWLTFYQGGSVKIYQCDVSGWGGSMTQNTYLFNLLGVAHPYGTCFFLADGLRIEHKSNYALLMHTQWPQGSICFALLDQSSQVQSYTSTNACFFNDLASTGMPNIEFRQCLLIGQHVYHTGGTTNNYNYQQKAVYRNCDILQWSQAAQFAINTDYSNYVCNAPNIRFEDCRSNENIPGAGYKTLFDTDLFVFQSCGGLTQTKTFMLCYPVQSGNVYMPSGGTSFAFLAPQGARLTNFRIYKPAGGTSGAYSFAIQSTDATPVVYATISGANSSVAIYQSVAIYVPLTTSTLWNFVLIDLAGRTSPFLNCDCMVDYIG